MTPEFPRAPLSAPRATAAATSPTLTAFFACISLTAELMVWDMFVPVSPSGTGKTFSASTLSRFWVSSAAPDWIISLNSSPSIFACGMICKPPLPERAMRQTRMSSTQTLTRPTLMPVKCSTLYFTVSMMEAATALMEMPYSTMMNRSISTFSPF